MNDPHGADRCRSCAAWNEPGAPACCDCGKDPATPATLPRAAWLAICGLLVAAGVALLVLPA